MSTVKPRLGIDVGGTNTDAVIMVGDEVIASTKQLTTRDVRDGVIAAVRAVLDAAAVQPGDLGIAMIGTTQFINAFVQRKDLSQIAAVRVSLPKTDGIPPMVGWPSDLLDIVGRHYYFVGGGAFYDGREYAALDVAAPRAAIASEDVLGWPGLTPGHDGLWGRSPSASDASSPRAKRRIDSFFICVHLCHLWTNLFFSKPPPGFGRPRFVDTASRHTPPVSGRSGPPPIGRG